MRIVKTIKGDHLTPVTIFLRLTGQKSLLESDPRGEKARYSIIGIDPVDEFTYQNRVFTTKKGQFLSDDPLAELEKLVVKGPATPELPFQGGAIGYVAYDIAACYEEIGELPADELQVPDLHFFLYDLFVIYDHQQQQVMFVHQDTYQKRSEEELNARIQQMIQELQVISPFEAITSEGFSLKFTSNTTQQEFEEMVKQAKELIQSGDLFQVVCSQRLQATFEIDPFEYYRHLRSSNPSAYMYYLDFGDYQVIGSSPESLVSVKAGLVITNPIAGTRPRHQDPVEDQRLAEELLADPKERAEHMMLVDLGRNDIGKVSRIGTVQVPLQMVVEKYRYVMHIVSLVTGELAPQLTVMDALRATLPAGTVSGAPKIRAMTRIYQFEQVKRSIYAGAVGYLSSNGDGDFAIGIRTMVVKAGQAYVQAGAGIVYDSDPTSEYLETLQKAKALLEVGA